MKFTRRVLCVLSLVSFMGAYAAEGESHEAEATVPAGKLNVLLQTWAVVDGTTSNTYFDLRARRAEIKWSANVSDEAKFFVMVDPVKSLAPGSITTTNDNKILQDLALNYSLSENFEFQIGQFKLPLMAEGLASSADLPLIERSLPARTYGDKREPALMLSCKVSDVKIMAALSNGQGNNVDDVNTKKDLSIRTEWAPTPKITVGAFTLLGDYQYSAKGRWGLNLGRKTDLGFGRMEYVQASTNGVTSKGMSVEAGYTGIEKWTPAIRLESLWQSGQTFTPLALSAALTYSWVKYARVAAALSYLKKMNGSLGSPVPSATQSGALFLMGFQMNI